MQSIFQRLKNRFWQRSISDRPLPEFIIVGAQKAGTTSLFAYLKQHPELLPAPTKEVHYFDGGLDPAVDNFAKGEAWYRSHFPVLTQDDVGKKAFEASPMYLFNPPSAQRIAQALPHAKIIAILRDPVERAISHYFHEKRKGREELDIMQALQAEEQRLSPIVAAGDFKHAVFKDKTYKMRGIYHQQLQRYFDCFPSSQILILQSEKLFEQPAETLRQVYRFVGVSEDFEVDDLSPRNAGTNRTKVSKEVYDYLSGYFKSHNEILYNLIGTRFNWSGKEN